MFFTVKFLKDNDISILKDGIKEKNSIQLTNFDACELILHNVSLSLADFETQFDTLKLESYPILSDADKISTIFPNTSDDRRVHIAVDLPSGTPAYMSFPNNLRENTSPSLRHALYSIDEENQFICMSPCPHFQGSEYISSLSSSTGSCGHRSPQTRPAL